MELFNPNIEVGSIIRIGTYPHYLPDHSEEIEWIVLKNDKGVLLLISKYALITTAYCDVEKLNKELSCLEWQNSLAKEQCINFYKNAFSSKEKEILLQKQVLDNESNEEYVFLLTEKEVNEYLPNSSLRKAKPTHIALEKGARLGWTEDTRDYTSWWIMPEIEYMECGKIFSSEGTEYKKHINIYPKAVFQNGEIQFHGRNVYHKDFTIRPCICIDYEKYIIEQKKKYYSAKYEYDSKTNTMIRLCPERMPLIIRKRDLRWKTLGGLDDLYLRAIYAGQGCWENLNAINEEQTNRILNEWGYAERMNKYFDLIKSRHSVRQYLDKSIPDRIRKELDTYVQWLNVDSALNIQIVYDEPECFNSAKAKYGSFRGCSNYISIVGNKGIGDLEERCGFYGELLVLKAQELGLNTCWVALTHGKSKAVVKDNEKEVIIVSLGYGKTQGTEHKSKSALNVSNITHDSPEWAKKGVESALLAPTAINQQKFKFIISGNKVYLESGKLGPCLKIDLGIVRCHFELGAGRENFEWEYRPLNCNNTKENS